MFVENAFERLNKVAPELTGLIVTFKDMSQELPEGSTTQVGCFILRAGTSFFLVPVVAKGDTVLPIDSYYDMTQKMFRPLTPSSVDSILATPSSDFGKPTKIPRTADTNPSMRQLVDPPKTGKYAYAGSHLEEFLAILPKQHKDVFLEKLASDLEFAQPLNELFGLHNLVESLRSHSISEPESVIEPEVSIITDGENLDHGVVQEILDHGYAVVGEHRNPTFAIEYMNSNEAFTNSRSAEIGKAYEFVMKDGKTIVGFAPRMIPQRQTAGVPGVALQNFMGAMADQSHRTQAKPAEAFFVFEDGTYAVTGNAVVKTNPRDLIDTVMHLVDRGHLIPMDRVMSGDIISIMTPNGFYGLLQVLNVVVGPTGVVLTTTDALNVTGHFDQAVGGVSNVRTIHVAPGMHGAIDFSGSDVYVNGQAQALVLSENRGHLLEDNINSAVYKRDQAHVSLLKSASEILFDGVEYFLDGQPLHTKAAVAKDLIVSKGLSKQAAEAFIAKAQENGKVTILMSKSAAAAPVPSEIPEYGENVPDQGEMWDTRKYDESFSNIRNAAMTNDKEVVEASIISEFLHDTGMYETIESYLPSLSEALDRIGRILLIIRINTDSAQDSLDSEELSNLLTSLRNTYRTLGDQFLKLSSMVSSNMNEVNFEHGLKQ